MATLNKKQREYRDRTSAEAAVEMAVDRGKKAGIAVDDQAKVTVMVERVVRALEERGVTYTIETRIAGTTVALEKGGGSVYVFAADKLIPPSQRLN